MNLYITGSLNRQDIDELAAKLTELGYKCTTPYDVIDDGQTENESLRARLNEVLRVDALVTTSPACGSWSPGAVKELALARIHGGIKVHSAAVALEGKMEA